jgi:hypothetical protein
MGTHGDTQLRTGCNGDTESAGINRRGAGNERVHGEDLASHSGLEPYADHGDVYWLQTLRRRSLPLDLVPNAPPDTQALTTPARLTSLSLPAFSRPTQGRSRMR